MAKNYSFDKFRETALSSGASPLRDAATAAVDTRVPVRPEPAPVAKKSKNADSVMISFNMDKQFKNLLAYVKLESGKSYNELYNEAIEDLLKKYGKL